MSHVLGIALSLTILLVMIAGHELRVLNTKGRTKSFGVSDQLTAESDNQAAEDVVGKVVLA